MYVESTKDPKLPDLFKSTYICLIAHKICSNQPFLLKIRLKTQYDLDWLDLNTSFIFMISKYSLNAVNRNKFQKKNV